MSTRLTAAACAIAALVTLAAMPAHAARFAPKSLADTVAIAPWNVHQGRINGRLENRGDRTILRTVVLVRYGWLWDRPELADTDADPGWAEYVTISEPLAPGASLPFVYAPGRPLAVREGGRYVPSVEVVSVTLQPPAG